jgi:hypothetical protein
MKKEDVALRLEKLRLAFFASPTKGIIFYENILLPEDDKGLNEEGFNNLREAFHNKDQEHLVAEVIKILKELRELSLINADIRKLIEEHRKAVLEDVVTYRILASHSED